MGRIRTPRRSQPQQPVAVDFPYAKASLCVNYAVGGKNLIDGSNPSVRSGAGTRAPSAFGVCKTGYDGGSNTAADVYGIPSTSVFTLVCVYDLSGSSGSYSPIIGGDQTGNRQFQLRVTPSNTIEFIRFNTSVSTFTATTTTTGRTGCIVAVSNGSSVRLIHKGIVSSTATITGTPKPLTVVAPGGYLGFDQQPLVGDRGVSMCAVLPFALSNAEAVALSLNPWQIFAPTTRNISSPVTAGGDSTITQADGTSTASSLGGSATAATTPAAADGTSTAASIAASATAAAAVTQADGASTASTLGGSAVNAAVITQADAATTASTLTGAGLTAGASSITAAAGTSAESTLAGSSVAASDVSAAGGVSTGETLTGVAGTNIVAGSITPASGGTTASDFAASATAAAVAIAAAGASAAATLTSNGVMAIAGAMAGRRMAVTGRRPDRLQTSARPAR